MSTEPPRHNDQTPDFEGGGPGQRGRARCYCGWTGPWHKAGDYDARKLDFRSHILAELGEAMAYYEAAVKCLNCAYRGPAKLLIGTSVWAAICPMCNVSGRLRPDNEFIDDEHERDKARWR